ncbi:modification methylase MjaIIIM [Thermoclostridium stercorarium subsp. stercorarium DSM 8532]|uniref:Site-specific DNA-methyltransferase (adenine-specific) n=1 Tax=Thermoclostridium stercorarium (strain ATCC 35414 / DSM 8532 / NCIMB 11754) TaxID=1121335 RepID=L7VI47_THES1|nr:modification methylase MjaIIIM [Thermoclostridium stercorarium subsp. stercorarium DSM 8532]
MRNMPCCLILFAFSIKVLYIGFVFSEYCERRNKVGTVNVKPFVKWAGGKRQLLGIFRQYYPTQLTEGKIKRYIEPFAGGGAVLFDILQTYDIEEAFIFDINEDLINTYLAIKNEIRALVEYLADLECRYLNLNEKFRREMYYEIRYLYNSRALNYLPDIESAAQFIFLNRTCFNGLYRVNRSGRFNVPHGEHKNPTICDVQNLYAASSLLQKVHIFAGDYRESAKHIDKCSFVYFDPPYRPLNITSSFTSYSKFDFTDDDQVRLAQFFAEMSNTGAFLMLSNSDPKNVNPDDNFFDELYKDFYIHRIKAKRAINSNGKRRGFISEILVTNYKVY